MTTPPTAKPAYPPWLRRLLYAGAALVWLFILCLPLLGIILAMRGELRWQRGAHASDRIWLVQERRERGIGWEATRLDRVTDAQVCLETTVRFFLWRGDESGQNVHYCECYAREADGHLEYAGDCGSR